MPFVTTRLRNTMAANAWFKRDRRASNKEREREIRTITKKGKDQEQDEAEEETVMSKRRGMRRTRARMGRRRLEAWA